MSDYATQLEVKMREEKETKLEVLDLSVSSICLFFAGNHASGYSSPWHQLEEKMADISTLLLSVLQRAVTASFVHPSNKEKRRREPRNNG